MRSIPAVDDLILWHGAAILALAWFIVAAASIERDFAKPDYASWGKPIPCEVEYECDLSIRSSLQFDERQGPHGTQDRLRR
jgi:hypothetical protein